VPEELHGTVVNMALMTFAGPASEGEAAFAPFRAIGTPIADMVRPIKYAEMYPPEDESYRPIAAARNLFIDRVDLPTARTIVSSVQTHARETKAPMVAVQLRPLGGAMARVPVDATAFAHRQSRIMVNVAVIVPSPDALPEQERWVDSMVSTLRQEDHGVYVNFLVNEPARIREAYPGPTWDRLVELKRRYDPTNLFHRNQNIPPDAATA
jgi:hypothetical protein